MKAARVGSIRLRAVVVWRAEVRASGKWNRRYGRRRVAHRKPRRRRAGQEWESGVVERRVEAVEVRAIEEIEGFAQQLDHEPLAELDVARDAQVNAIVRVAVIAVARHVGREVQAAEAEDAAEARVLRAVERERNIRQRNRGRERAPAFGRENSAEPVTVEKGARQRVASLELRQIPDAVDDEAMTLVGRRGSAILFQVKLIEEARSAEGILRATAPAVACG